MADNSLVSRWLEKESSVILKSQRFTCIKSLLLQASLTDGQTINIELISSWRGDGDILSRRIFTGNCFQRNLSDARAAIGGMKV